MHEVKVGDMVTRILAGIPMKLKVSALTEDKIICGPWEFCAVTGAEIDDALHWGPPPASTGSYLEPEY